MEKITLAIMEFTGWSEDLSLAVALAVIFVGCSTFVALLLHMSVRDVTEDPVRRHRRLRRYY